MIVQRINHWLIKIKKYLFTYKDGYFDLPYLSNSPAIMVESFKRMPFTKYYPDKGEIHTDNIFTDGIMRYCELEDGLWIIMTEIEFKKNVSTHALYDNEPTDYHFLAHSAYDSPVERVGFNNTTITTNYWGFYKPGTEIKAFFNKGDKGLFTNFAFTRIWFERNIPLTAFDDGHDFKSFFESGDIYKTWDNMVAGSDAMIREILVLLKERRHQQERLIPLKMLCLQIIAQFFASITTGHKLQPSIRLNNHDSRMVARTEKILLDNLLVAFPGIDELAETLHISSTKLQNLFKAVHGSSIYQYYQERQMALAYQMLKASPKSLKEIALTFGYKNPSKFSVAFKKYHHILPSEVYQNVTLHAVKGLLPKALIIGTAKLLSSLFYQVCL